MSLNSKYKDLSPNYFTRIRPEIERYNALNLSEGYTGFHCSDELTGLIKKHVSEGLNQYGETFGEFILRKKVAEKIEKLYGHSYDPDKEVTITAGAVQAINTIFSAILKEGDEVIVFEPACINIIPAIKMNGGQPVFIPIDKKTLSIDWEQVQKMITTQTRIIFISNPHSPTGMIFNELDMLRLQKIINGTNILVLSDETFEHVVFDSESHQSMALFPILAGKSIIVSSFGETYHVTGWQTGYCLAPENVTKEIRKVQEIALGKVNTPFQLAFADILEKENEYLLLSGFYQKKRDMLNDMLESTPFKPVITKGSYFEMIDFSEVSSDSDLEYALKLIQNYGLSLAPLSAFSHNKSKEQLLRINFAQTDEVLIKAVELLKLAASE